MVIVMMIMLMIFRNWSDQSNGGQGEEGGK